MVVIARTNRKDKRKKRQAKQFQAHTPIIKPIAEQCNNIKMSKRV